MLEPIKVYPEAVFQAAIVSVARGILTNAGRPFEILDGFGLDVAVFSSDRVRFFEVKAFGGQRVGGVGFGDRHGNGAQVDLLLCENKNLSLFDTLIRWVYADGTEPPGSARYALFTCAKAKNSAMANTVCRGKQNNLRLSALRGGLVPWAELCAQVRAFLLD